MIPTDFYNDAREAYRSGARAYREGASTLHNPYRGYAGEKDKLWEFGWLDAANDRVLDGHMLSALIPWRPGDRPPFADCDRADRRSEISSTENGRVDTVLARLSAEVGR